jgi:uncharacterized protein (DUF697 family)
MNSKKPSTPAKAVTGKTAEAEQVIRYHVVGATALGLVPVPLLDLALISGVQLDMLYHLARVYEVSFSRQIGKSVIASLVGASLSVPFSSAVKLIPVAGTILGGVTFCVVAGASTYAIGKVFVQHFESGGTFLTFDPEKVRSYYRHYYERGKVVVEGQTHPRP